jgi:regulator of protease activity HflC (stomatin/prohibitin superfamily)
MDAALGWIGSIIEWLGLFIPRRIIVRNTDKLIKFLWNGSVIQKEAGLRWYWPFTTEVVEITVVRQPLNIDIIQFTTSDGISCAADCSVTYYIEDPIMYLTGNWDSSTALSELVSAVLCKKLRSMTFAQIQNNYEIDEELTELVFTDCESFGIEVEYVRLNRFIKIYAISLLNNNVPKIGDNVTSL